MLSDVGKGLMLSSDNPLDFHSEMYLVLAIILKYLCTGWNIKYLWEPSPPSKTIYPQKVDKISFIDPINSIPIDSFFFHQFYYKDLIP